jgi:hypothetical protein
MPTARMELASELLPIPDRYEYVPVAGTAVRKPGQITLGWDTLDRSTSQITSLATVNSLLTAYTDHAPGPITFKDDLGTSHTTCLWLEPPRVTHLKGTKYNLFSVEITLVEM